MSDIVLSYLISYACVLVLIKTLNFFVLVWFNLLNALKLFYKYQWTTLFRMVNSVNAEWEHCIFDTT